MQRIKHVQAHGRTKLIVDDDMVLDLEGTFDLVGIMKMVYAAGKNQTPINFMREHIGETMTTTDSTDTAEAAPPPERETETIHPDEIGSADDLLADPVPGKPQAEEAGK